MKKNRSSVSLHAAVYLIKCLLMMKIVTLLICLFSLQTIANDGFAQETITLKLENSTLRKAFKVIEKNTSFRFVYNEEILPSDQRISINVHEQPVANVMKMLLENTSLIHRIVGSDLIVISTENTNGIQAAPAFTVNGKVVNSRSEPLSGISVLEKGTTNGTTTGDDGTFSLNVTNENVTLVISSVGYTPREIPVAGRRSVTIDLQENIDDLNQVVVVGYGTQKRSDITGAVASVPKSRLSQLPVTNILHAIQGSVAGVNVTQSSSVPGSSAEVLVRGRNSIAAETGPFVVLDGIPYSTIGGSINDINPNDIASIEILKDASAVAIYGTRGANGVILITTKRGATGKPVIRYSGYAGTESMAHVLEPMSSSQYVKKYADWMLQSNRVQTDPVPTATEIANYNAGKTVDWIDEVSQSGYITNHNLSISGGTKDVKYYLSGDYLKQQGILKGYQYGRASIRTNLDANITDYLSTGVTLFFTANNYDGGRVNLNQASQMSPYGQLYNANGTYALFPMHPELLYTNPLLGLNVDRYDRTKNLNGNVYVELKPGFLKGLKYRINAGYTYVPLRRSSYTGRNANNNLGSASINQEETNSWVIENILSYVKDWDRHHVDVTGLYSAQQTEFFSDGSGATGFINDLISYYNLGAGATQTAGSSRWRTNLLSQMARVNYSFDSRYLVTLTARRDAYSAFGANTDKYGLFPSFAVGWNISNESFMSNIAFINNLKLRGSYGKSGNQAIGVNQTATTSTTVRFPFNGVSTIGVLANILGNRDLNWETTKGFNIGFDFSVLKNRISGTIDYYRTETEDLLLQRALPIATGFTQVWDNIGSTANRGIEVTINSVNVNATDFRWESSLNFASNKNKIVSLYGDNKNDVGNRWFIGQPISIIYDYQMVGVWQEGEDATQWDPGVRPGDLKFADINGDKRITADDRIILGQTSPKWIGGLTNTFHYKNWHLNVFVQTFQGALLNNPVLTNADQAGIINIPAEVTYWTTENKSNNRPAIRYTNPRGYGYPSDAGYTRIKDVTLSFTAPQGLLDKLKVAGLTIYVSGRNLATFTDWIGWDPENTYDRAFGNATNNYPLVRTIVLGANVSLR